jgi:hypothetical protein
VTISNEVQIYNLALNAVGARSNISSPSESSREAEVCRLWFEPVRDQILAAAPWPEATETRYLTQLAEADADGDGEWAYDDPRPGYSYVYSLPSDMIQPLYLTDFSRFFITGYSGNRRVLHTQGATPILIYTKRLENIALWGPQLQMAIVYGLAAHICMPLSGKPSRARMLAQQANDLIWQARETAANMSNEHFDPVPDWISARGYNFSSNTRYVHPLGSTLSLSNVN